MWDDKDLEHHSCPWCGNECPPRGPVHGPPIWEMIKAAVDLLAAGAHDLICPLYGESPTLMGYSNSKKSAYCECPQREVYRLWLRMAHPPEEEEEE